MVLRRVPPAPVLCCTFSVGAQADRRVRVLQHLAVVAEHGARARVTVVQLHPLSEPRALEAGNDF